MRKKILASTMASVALVLASASAEAQSANSGIALDRFNPSERGSEWFALDTLDLRGSIRPAVGVVAEYANLPLVTYNPNGSVASNVVAGQAFLHAGASINLLDRIRLAFNVPVVLVNTGTSGGGFTSPDLMGVGDIRASADLRLAGEFGGPAELALGGQVFLPTGESKRFTGDDFSRGIVHLSLAGEAGAFIWSVKAGAEFRAHARTFTQYGFAYGDEFQFGAAAGVRVADKKLVIGPEIFGASVFYPTGSFFKYGSTPAEALLGLHYTIGSDWRVGAGAGPGITYDLGSPRWRGMISFEWVPAYKEPVHDRDHDGVLDNEDACPDVPGVRTDDPKTNGCPPPPKVIADRDHDGVPDDVDACPDVPGVKTDDPKTNGCPPDRDHDGVPDKDDACPDVPGVKTDDPKTNGCPSDRDHDGIIDSEDACPDIPGVKTSDPKTNGCPLDPDRDKDGIKNEDDACPDEAGVPDPDPKKNGCPKVRVVGTQITISDQVKFATASAIILPASNGILTDVAKVLKDHPEIKRVRVEGHTDNQGPAGYNKTLSAQRAASVVKWLTAHGVEKSRLHSEGFGMEKPIDTNDTPAGRQNNRRVEFHIEND